MDNPMLVLHPVLLVIAAVIFGVTAYLAAERVNKLLAVGLMLLALAMWR
jgi:uncharacterized membrane protein